jgi:hypothetical protein
MNLFKKIFVFTLIFTAASWSMAYVFSAMAGETPKSTVKKLQSRLNEGQLVEEKESLDMNGVEEIQIETAAADITAEAVVGDQATVEFAGTVSPGGKVLKIERNGNKLVIGVDQNRGTKGFVWTFDDDDGPNVKVTTFKGLRLSLPANIGKTLKIETRSGDIKLKRIVADNLEIHASSGDVELNDCGARVLATVQTTSGDIEVHGFAGKLRTTSTSGDFDGERISGEALESQSTSGDISVSLPEPAGWKFMLSATSGDIENDFKDDANADKIMQIRSTSGDIRIRK